MSHKLLGVGVRRDVVCVEYGEALSGGSLNVSVGEADLACSQ